MRCGTPPSEVLQGDSYSWATRLDEYAPPGGWSLTTTIRAGTGAVLTLSGVPQADGFYRTTLTKVQSAGLVLGLNAWAMQASRDEDLHTVGTGKLTVRPSIVTTAPGDLTTPAERYLAALEEIGPTMMANGYAEMELDGGHAVFRTLKDYNDALKFARSQVQAERSAGRNRTIPVHFRRH